METPATPITKVSLYLLYKGACACVFVFAKNKIATQQQKESRVLFILKVTKLEGFKDKQIFQKHKDKLCYTSFYQHNYI